MKRKGIMYGAFTIVLLVLMIAWLAPSHTTGVSAVRIGFAGFEVINGKRSFVLIVTNGSSYRISRPGGNYEIRGESRDGSAGISSSSFTTACGFGSADWGWWQLRLPTFSDIAPGATFRFTIPMAEAPFGDYTWHVTIPLRTIPFKDRLPYAIGSRWPKFKGDAPISFEVISSPITFNPFEQSHQRVNHKS